MLDILAATLEMQFSDTAYEAGDTESLFLKAKCFVNANLDDYRLTTQYIADALGISRRTLARAFAKHDATLMHYIWSRRLEVSHALLAEGKVKQITDAAIQTGFCDLWHYSRAFKKKYGVSPSEIFSKIG
ncbi:transcriptional regulator, AraC family protein [Pseudomonas syringae pv. aceris str. M302273]|nr:transcriptional regulator, AraC family protein [Pseudomonas syringae pv. aceris str. M302273]